MLPTLDYILFYAQDVSDFISNKLCAFYNKEISGHPTRVIFSIPHNVRSSLIDKYKEIFDETTLFRYDPAEVTFWQCRNLIRMAYYTQFMGDHILIDHGHVFRHLSDDVSGLDVGYVVGPSVTSSLINKVLQKLPERFANLDPQEIHPLDFSALYLSEEIKPQVKTMLGEIISTYSGHVHRTEAYAILSVILHYIDPNLKSAPISLEPGIDISESPLLKDFYTLL